MCLSAVRKLKVRVQCGHCFVFVMRDSRCRFGVSSILTCELVALRLGRIWMRALLYPRDYGFNGLIGRLCFSSTAIAFYTSNSRLSSSMA